MSKPDSTSAPSRGRQNLIIVLMTIIGAIIGALLAASLDALTSPAAPALFAGLGAIFGFVMSRRGRSSTRPASTTQRTATVTETRTGQPGGTDFTQYTGDSDEGGDDQTRPRVSPTSRRTPHGAQSPWADQ